MIRNFSFKFFACAMFLAFSVLSGGGCGGSDSCFTNGDNPNGDTTLGDVFENGATVTVGFSFFGEDSSATFKHEGDKYSLVEKGGNFADDFDNANAWTEESNFVVQLYLEKGWQLAVASNGNNLPAEDVWEIAFNASDDTYVDRVRTGVFKTASEDFVVFSIKVNDVEFIDTLEPLPYEEQEIPEPTPTPTPEPEDPSDDDNGGNNDGDNSGGDNSGGNGGDNSDDDNNGGDNSDGGSTPAPTPVTYTVTVGSITNGTVTASATSATAGTQITLTVTPNTGYELDTLTVKDANNSNVTVSNNKFNMPASNVNVTATFKVATIAVASVTLNSSDLALGIGQNATLVATVLPTNATNKTVTWTTSSSDIVTVDQSGKVTAIAKGTATITATAGGKSATCTVNVGVLYLSRSYDATTQKVVTETKAAVDYELVTASTTEFTNGKYYVVSGDVTIDASSGFCITTKGTAHLILCDGATLTAGKAIDVSDGSNGSFTGTLHIYAQSDANAGHLVSTGTHAYSGIGGGSSNGGTLYIHGGVITATGGNSGGAGAGIGGGKTYKGGNVYIFGGTITATGGSYNNNNGTIEAAAGIGGGGGTSNSGSTGDGGNVYIYGGTVTATGGYVAPGPYNSSPVIGKGIGAGDGSMNNGSLTIGAGLTVSYSDDGTNYNNYTDSDYSTRYQYMKVEPSDNTMNPGQ